ncbi:hypothetical protein ACQB60_23525 [Actinomycetota bacterium Odt1-20B]
MVCGGSWSDWMVKRGMSASFARKTPIVVGLGFAGIVFPVVIGYTVGGAGGPFTLPLLLIAGITVGGALSFLFLVDKVERIEA